MGLGVLLVVPCFSWLCSLMWWAGFLWRSWFVWRGIWWFWWVAFVVGLALWFASCSVLCLSVFEFDFC